VWLAVSQVICANFFAPASGTYGDQAEVTVSGEVATDTAHGVNGMLLAVEAGSDCTRWELSQEIARLDLQLVGVDPGEQVRVELGGAAYTILAEQLVRNPDVTAEPLILSAGALGSEGADGSAALEITEAAVDDFAVCASSGGGEGGVIARPVINSYCQCGNGSRHDNEGCDDGGTEPDDGCAADCTVEPGWSCAGAVGETSVCTLAVPDAGPGDAAGGAVDSGSDLEPLAHPAGCCDGGGGGAGAAALAAVVAFTARRRRWRSTTSST
jgi:cysteine-rich repeat protein